MKRRRMDDWIERASMQWEALLKIDMLGRNGHAQLLQPCSLPGNCPWTDRSLCIQGMGAPEGLL
jgi:hypothetical protein